MEHHEWRPPLSPPPPLQAGTYPPPPMFYQGPRFPPPTLANYPRPDLYHAPSPNDGWHPHPNYDHHVEGFPPRPRYDYGGFGSGINNGSNGYASEVDRIHKRPRVDDSGSGAFGFSSDDERRLKLIRDHGGGGSGGFGGNFANAMPPEPHGYHPHWGKAEPAASGGGSNNLYSPFQPTDGNLQWRNQGAQYPHWQEPPPPPPPPHSHLYGVAGSYGRPHYQSAGFVSNFNEPGGGYTGSHEIRVSMAQPPVARPPLPPLPHPSPPPPPPPTEPPVDPSPPKLFPVPISSETTNPYHANASNGFGVEEWRTSSRQHVGEGRNFLRKPASPEKPTFIDASHLFKQPYRATRPDHIVIILRGLPGSGKSYIAKMMRDLEVENGGSAPRIHSMDDYFMTEVEKVEKSDAAKSSSSARGKKPTVKRVLEYCYEPEMEEAYRESMLKSFKKTLEEGTFAVVIVDDRNLRVADFAQFWAIGKRSGYEVYISEASYKDPAGCAARNVHGFTLDEIQKMAGQWEEAPPLYLQLDMKSLSHGDDLKENGIQEVDMDTEDGDVDNDPSGMQERKPESAMAPSVEDDTLHDGKRWDAEEDHLSEIKELGKSKWSDDIDDDDDTEGSEAVKGNLNALSELLQSYRKRGKSVQWSDQVGNTGFSIGVARKAMSLVMGPGAGYNLKSNPSPEEESPTSAQSNAKSRKQGAFQERLRAERESFKSVFDRRKQRIGGLDMDDE